MRVATVAAELGHDVEANLAFHLSTIDAAADDGCDLVVFPEVSLQGYPAFAGKAEVEAAVSSSYRVAEPVPGGAGVAAIAARAAARGIHVVHGVTERGDGPGVVFNSAVLTGPDGHIGVYRKVHLSLWEQLIWRAGDDWPVFDTAIGRIGMLICYDKVWPESCRELTLRGAELLVMPTAWSWGASADRDPATNTAAFQYLLYDQARAVENHRWLVSANLTGGGYFGHSQVVGPDGRVVVTTGAAAGTVAADIDVRGGIEAAMAAFQGDRVPRDRRPSTYRALRGSAGVPGSSGS